MTSAIMTRPATGDLEAEARRAGERYAELERELAEIDLEIAAAAHRRDAGAVVWLEQRKRELPAEVAAAKADYDEKRQAFSDAREREKQARLAHEQETEHELLAADVAALGPELSGVTHAYRKVATRIWRIAQLEQEITGRPAANEIDRLRRDAALFLAQGFARVLEWTWLGPDTDRVHYRPALWLTGPQGEAEKVVYDALFGNR